MAKINGSAVFLPVPVTVLSYLTEHGYQQNRIAVELNGTILPKSNYESALLQDSDTLEIVSFMGGG